MPSGVPSAVVTSNALGSSSCGTGGPTTTGAIGVAHSARPAGSPGEAAKRRHRRLGHDGADPAAGVLGREDRRHARQAHAERRRQHEGRRPGGQARRRQRRRTPVPGERGAVDAVDGQRGNPPGVGPRVERDGREEPREAGPSAPAARSTSAPSAATVGDRGVEGAGEAGHPRPRFAFDQPPRVRGRGARAAAATTASRPPRRPPAPRAASALTRMSARRTSGGAGHGDAAHSCRALRAADKTNPAEGVWYSARHPPLMALSASPKLALKRGALITAANWQVVVLQWVADSVFTALLAVPVVGGAALVVLTSGLAPQVLFDQDLRRAVPAVAAALLAHPIALAAFLTAVLVVVLGGSLFMAFVKGGTITVLASRRRRRRPARTSAAPARPRRPRRTLPAGNGDRRRAAAVRTLRAARLRPVRRLRRNRHRRPGGAGVATARRRRRGTPRASSVSPWPSSPPSPW